MRRHRLDPLSLICGLAFLGLALLTVADAASLLRARWVGAFLLLAVGAGLLLSSRPGRDGRAPDADPDRTPPE